MADDEPDVGNEVWKSFNNTARFFRDIDTLTSAFEESKLWNERNVNIEYKGCVEINDDTESVNIRVFYKYLLMERAQGRRHLGNLYLYFDFWRESENKIELQRPFCHVHFSPPKGEWEVDDFSVEEARSSDNLTPITKYLFVWHDNLGDSSLPKESDCFPKNEWYWVYTLDLCKLTNPTDMNRYIIEPSLNLISDDVSVEQSFKGALGKPSALVELAGLVREFPREKQ